MENSVFEISMIGAMASVSIVVITELTKIVSRKLGREINSKYIVLVLSFFVAGVYQAYTQFMPEATQSAIYAFVAGSAGFATFIYSFLVKPLKK